MRGLILLDGPDCAGKTTLANAIKAEVEKRGYVANIHHLGKPEPGTCWAMHAEALLNNIYEMLNGAVVIMDRQFLSEGIYGAVYRDGSEYPETMRFMDMLFNRYRALKVICCPAVETVVKTHAAMKKVRFEEYDSGMDKVAQRYLDLWESVPRSMIYSDEDYLIQLTKSGGVSEKELWYHYDYEQVETADFVKMLLAEMVKEQWYYEDDTWHYSFNGTPGPLSTLLVGDQISQDNILAIPFFANTDSSLYLAKTLHQLHTHPDRLCIANINDPGGVETVKFLANRCKQVIALGRNAQRTLQLHNIHFHGQVRHPQHARRFSYNDDSYVNELAQFLI